MTCKHTSASRPVLSHSQRSRFNLISGSGRDRATDDEDKFQLKIDRHFPPFFASKDSNLRRGNINQHSSFPLFSAFIFSVLLNFGWLDRDWTPNPISVQGLSKPCPTSVQSSKKSKACPEYHFFCLRYTTTCIIDDVEEGRVANWTSPVLFPLLTFRPACSAAKCDFCRTAVLLPSPTRYRVSVARLRSSYSSYVLSPITTDKVNTYCIFDT